MTDEKLRELEAFANHSVKVGEMLPGAQIVNIHNQDLLSRDRQTLALIAEVRRLSERVGQLEEKNRDDVATLMDQIWLWSERVKDLEGEGA